MKSNSSEHSKLARARCALVAAALVVSAGVATEGHAKTFAERCSNEWAEAPAYTYCSTATVSVSRNRSTGAKFCRVSGSCSISVDVDQTSTEFTPDFDYTTFRRKTDDIDICFAYYTTNFQANVRDNCFTSETDSSTAVTDGLTTPEPASEGEDSSAAGAGG